MKTVYIPKGETVHYESLATEHLVVRGHLHVDYGIKAKTITGGGTINAGTVDADVIRVDDVESGSIVCKRLLAKRLRRSSPRRAPLYPVFSLPPMWRQGGSRWRSARLMRSTHRKSST